MGTYWPSGQIPLHDAAKVLGHPCVSCGRILTADNLAAITDKVGVCTSCRPKGQVPPGMTGAK